MIDRLSPENFTLRAIGVNIYARMWSSPILIADMPETAEKLVGMLNDYELIRRKVQDGGPLVVTGRDMPDVNW